MKYSKIFAAWLACLFISSSVHALTLPQEGQDKRVEWKVVQSWPTKSKTVSMVHSLDGKYVFILNDKSQVQIFDRKGQLQGSIPVSENISAIDIAPQGESLYLIDNEKNTFSTVSVSFVVDVNITDSPVRGPADAPVTVAVFTDFE